MGRIDERQPSLCFDRTPLLISVVILPLAASCVLMAGGFWLRTMDTGRSGDSNGQMRIALVERERREENHEIRGEDGGEEQAARRDRLTSTPALSQPTDFAVATAPVPAVPDAHADFLPTVSSANEPISPRGPPDDRA